MQTQLTLFDEPQSSLAKAKAARAGSFVDNMALPVHRWFRYSAGFAAQWVEQVLRSWEIHEGQAVLDPFAGSGTVCLACDTLGLQSIGIEAHPVVARLGKAKLLWATSIDRFSQAASRVLGHECNQQAVKTEYPTLIARSFAPESLAVLDRLKTSWESLAGDAPEWDLVWLALTAILRPVSRVGTAQWQYILPNKTKKKTLLPLVAFQQQVENMKQDMRWMQGRVPRSHAQIHPGDARVLSPVESSSISAVITSPPYANNYDYADALRFEMTFWGQVSGWGDLHEKVRRLLVVSSSQHSSRERLKQEELLDAEEVAPIREELHQVVQRLGEVRENHGGKKHYHTMVAGYCRDMGQVLRSLRRVCKLGSRMCWVIGDSAPYGVYCPIEKWIAEMAVAAGFRNCRFEKLRDRNIKWKNRKHRVPLKEGLLWIDG
jgi:hypothetical protein